MSKEKEAYLKGLEHALKLTFTGMTLDMVRYWILKEHDKVTDELFEDAENAAADSARFPD